MFAFGIITIEVWETQFPVQWFILALVIGMLPALRPFITHLKRCI
jgi:hypothetical protein